jgi:precorrin-6y C5,15-methyltransferase (decarboxylating) CbiE subunit
MAKRLFAVGVGPGSPSYITDAARDAIAKSSFIVGYTYTLSTIRHLIKPHQQVIEVTMKDQEQAYQKVFASMKDNEYCTVPFTGDVNFSESEVVDRLLEIFGDENVELVPGISSIQLAAARCKVPLDKSIVITFHVTGDIEEKQEQLAREIASGKSAVIVPRPWPRDLSKHFMPREISFFLKARGIDTSKLKVWVFEGLSLDRETVFSGRMSDLESRSSDFDPLSVMVIDQAKRQTYLQF